MLKMKIRPGVVAMEPHVKKTPAPTYVSTYIGTFLTLIILSSLTLSASAAVYNVNRNIGGGSVVGTITTDGTLGAIEIENITAFDLTISSSDPSRSFVKNLSHNNANPISNGALFLATSTQLRFDFTSNENIGGSTGIFSGFFDGNTWWCLANHPTCGGYPEVGSADRISNENIGQQPIFTDVVLRSGLQTVASVSAVATVPVPAAAWLFGSALLGLFGLQRRNWSIGAEP